MNCCYNTCLSVITHSFDTEFVRGDLITSSSVSVLHRNVGDNSESSDEEDDTSANRVPDIDPDKVLPNIVLAYASL